MRLSTLQAGRAFAALLVVLFHLNGSIFGKEKYHADQFNELFSFGYAGVEFFFVLSGFVMVLSHRKSTGIATFIWRRFIRIYPVYWVILLPIIVAFAFLPNIGEGFERDPAAWFSAFALTPTPADQSILRVAWTLQMEMAFYLIFALAVFLPLFGRPVFLIWVLGSFLAYFIKAPFPISFVFSHFNLLFVAGMIAAWLYLRGAAGVTGATISLSVGVGCFLALGAWSVHLSVPREPLSAGFGLASAAAILGAASLERSRGGLVPAPLRLLGDASYSIYLTHFPILSVLAKVWSRLDLWRIPDGLTFFSMFMLSVGAGVVFHLTVERTVLNFLLKLRWRTQVAVAA